MLYRMMTRIFLTMALLTTLAACSQQTPEERSNLAQKYLSFKLDLTKDQKALMKDIADEMVTVAHEIRREREIALQEVLGEKFDEAKAVTRYDEQLAMFQKAGKTLIPKMAKFYNALDAEQRKDLQTMVKKYTATKGGSSPIPN